MAMPRNLVLVRHLESEGNLLQKLIKSGKPAPAEILKVEDYQFRGSPHGEWQAKITGEYIRSLGLNFFRAMASDYVRPQETVVHMNLGLEWMISPFLIERSWGDHEELSDEARRNETSKKRKHPLYWRPKNGEPLVSLFNSNAILLDTLHRECEDKDVILVTHGERIIALMAQLLRWTHQDLSRFMRDRDIRSEIRNCQVLHFTRQNPATGEVGKYLDWYKSVCPWDMEHSRDEWIPIPRHRFSEAELRERVEQYPRYLS